MDSTKKAANHNQAVALCKDIWGNDYASGGLECNEYPFQSTYEGVSVSTGGNWVKWQGSAPPIPALENSRGGTALGVFFEAESHTRQ